MRTWIVTVALLAACRGKVGETSKEPESAKAGARVATVAVATVLAKDDGKPPFLYIIENDDRVRVGAAKSWADLDANKLTVAKKAGDLDMVDRFVREDYALGIDPVKAVDTYSGIDIDLATLEDTANAKDDPPPPPEEEESGGTGTAMALDEGKMGRQDSDRAEGQYKMKKTAEDPQLARQQAIEQARAAGILGSNGLHVGYGIPASMRQTKPPPNEDGTPSRVAEVEGAVMTDGKLDRLRAMILIAPTRKATKLIAIVRDTDAAIAVSYNGKIRPLHVQFGLHDGDDAHGWLEARVSAKGLVIEAVPDVPIELATIDAKSLAPALDQARTARGTEPNAPVDVLVDADVDVQHLIDVIVALDTAGVRVIGMGASPPPEELARRGHRIPTVALGQPNAVGDLDKMLIRKVVRSSMLKIKACYETALATAPSLRGTVQVQFLIKPDGSVGTAAAGGVDPGVATCVENVIKGLTFPKPNGRATVQVNYPFLMRP